MSRAAEDHETSLEAAAAWRARIADQPSLRGGQAFQCWLEEGDNARAFQSVDATWTALGVHAMAPEVVALRQTALAGARRQSRRGYAGGHAMRNALAAAAAVVLLCIGGYGYYRTEMAVDTYATRPFERRSITLSDGSQVTLDSATQLRVRFHNNRRDLTLASGQASFEVAHDPARPFTVTAGDRNVRATGTAFNIEMLGPRTAVTLIQGRVLVSPLRPRPNDSAGVTLSAGQRLTAGGGAVSVRSVQAADATAWENGRLVFDDELLPDAIARMNRYAPRDWDIDPELRTLRISGVFNAGAPDAFIDALTTYFPIAASIGPDGRMILRPRAGAAQKK